MTPAARRLPLADAFQLLSSRRILLFGGKGGVGKTTVAVAAALHYGEMRKTLLFTTDPASNLSDIFPASGRRQAASDLTIESLNADRLYARFLDENLQQFLELGDRGTYLDKDELRRLFELSIPGIDELMAWMRIGELAEANPEAIVIVDTAPTGHTLRMIGAADHFKQLGVALDTMQQKHRALVRQFTRRSVRDALDEFLDDFNGKAERRRKLLVEHGAFVPVFLAESWVVDQTKRLIAEVQHDGINVPLAILNRVDPCGHSARAEMPVPVYEAPRACFPLDTPDAIRAWSNGGQPTSAVSSRSVGQPRAAVLHWKRLTFLAGKGGVGKTTASASIALQLAEREPHKKFTVISVDPAHSLRDVFACEKPPSNLAVEAIDTRAKWRSFRDSLGEEIERAVAALTPSGMSIAHDTDALRQLIEIAPPGADELFAIDRLADLIADEQQAAIIVDTAPTGHFLRLLDLPKTAGEWVREFMRLLLRYREVVPAGTLGEELLRASKALHAVESALTSDDCEVVVVTRPERVVIAETKRLIDTIADRHMHLGGIIANYMTPDSDCPCDQSMRRYEAAAVAELGRPVVMIERCKEPVVALADLATLVPLSSRA